MGSGLLGARFAPPVEVVTATLDQYVDAAPAPAASSPSPSGADDAAAAATTAAKSGGEPRKQKKHRRARRWFRIGWGGFLATIVLLVIGRAMLPWAVRSYVNRTIDQNPLYDGKIGDIDISLWRGAYTIE